MEVLTMAEKLELVPETGTTLEIAHSIGLIQIALLTALAKHSPEVLTTMQDYLATIKTRADKLKATDKQKRIILRAIGVVAGIA
jgi:hypothetical protein